MLIKSIHIKNFRSIVNEKIELNDLVVLIGNNDAGKSNYLKALNLFFNGQTDFDTQFSFDNDFCKVATVGKKMAREIIITIEFVPPNSYKEQKNILWKKVWRAGGEVQSKSKKSYENKREFVSSRSKVDHWMEHLKFRYVPAIKSEHYFQELLGDLSDTLADSVEKEIHEAAKSFTGKIQKSTNDISNELLSRLEIISNLILPQNLRQIFQTLDFNTKYENVELTLKYRGDGIKIRHIPVILKFLAEQDNRTRTQGAPKIDTIWGFEEPENNLELSKAFELAKDFYEYSNIIQIIITTHSPAFYSLCRLDKVYPEINNYDCEKVLTYYIEQDDSGYSSKAKNANDEGEFINEKMGLLPLVSPYIAEKVIENTALEQKNKELQELLANETKPVVLTEGKTDSVILLSAWGALYPDVEIPYHILSCSTTENEKEETAGASILKLALNSHRPNLPKMIGIFDYDREGVKEYKALTKAFVAKQVFEDYEVIVHKNNKCAAFCIPKVEGKEDYYNAQNLLIEFIFPEKYLEMKCSEGFGLEFKQKMVDKKVEGILVSEEESVELCYRKIVNNKMHFASQIVPNLPSDAFDTFKLIFDLLEELFSEMND